MALTAVKRGKREKFGDEERKQGRKPRTAPSIEEWSRDEKEEQDHPQHVRERDKAKDFISDAMGTDFYSPNYSERWAAPEIGFFTVSRYYHHLKAIWDEPKTVQERVAKEKYFKEKGIHYFALNPGQVLKDDEARALFLKISQETKRS